jgi:glycosyltransferase involved in cell wall biosynthesis
VLLVFGAIRSDAERQLILDTFSNLNEPQKLLLVSRWREKLANVSWIRLKYWIRDLTRLYYKVRPGYRFNYGFVEEVDTQIYLNAADVLLIPRLHVLNSGNITLGMTFGRVVVGPDSWDVGSLLKETGNPVFDPDSPGTAAAAVERGFALAREGRIGAANRELALKQWTPEQCARSYVEFFSEVVSNRRSLPSLS